MDLSPAWIKENLEAAKADLVRAEVAYCAINHKETNYAMGIRRLIEAKRKIVQVWIEA